LSFHLKNTKRTQFESISINVRDVIMRQKKYLKIIKSNIYKKNSSQKLNIFIRICQIIFDVRLVIYKNDAHRINLSNLCWATMSQNSIESDRDIDCDSMRQRSSFLIKSSFAIFWENRWARRSFE
jgi:hypothetical protein